MTSLDDRLTSAAKDLRQDLDQRETPTFVPSRSRVPVVVAVVLVLGIGLVGYVANSWPEDSADVSVVTQPAVPDGQRPIADEPLVGRLTAAADGEFWVPTPFTQTWSADESMVLLYRTGAATPGHVVVDTASGAIVAELPVTPADVEQIYWHPLEDRQLVYTVDNELRVYDLVTETSRVEHRFDGCDRVDSGTAPVPPSTSGFVSLLCHFGTTQNLASYDLATQTELRVDQQGAIAAFPSPDGQYFVHWNGDGSASVLDGSLSDTGVVVELDNNMFVFVRDQAGRQWIAATLFDGPAIGTLVLLPLDGRDPPIVVIGPERGDAYPPSRTQLAAVRDQVAIAIAGADDGTLAGRITLVDLGAGLTNPVRSSITHGNQDIHGYWSSPFVALSPSGRFVLFSSDQGTDRVDTFVTDIGAPTN